MKFPEMTLFAYWSTTCIQGYEVDPSDFPVHYSQLWSGKPEFFPMSERKRRVALATLKPQICSVLAVYGPNVQTVKVERRRIQETSKEVWHVNDLDLYLQSSLNVPPFTKSVRIIACLRPAF